MSADVERDVMAELAEEQPQGAEALDEYEAGEGEGYEEEGEDYESLLGPDGAELAVSVPTEPYTLNQWATHSVLYWQEELGKRLIGQTVDAAVTTMLQTAAGRMIFARLRDEEPGPR